MPSFKDGDDEVKYYELFMPCYGFVTPNILQKGPLIRIPITTSAWVRHLRPDKPTRPTGKLTSCLLLSYSFSFCCLTKFIITNVGYPSLDMTRKQRTCIQYIFKVSTLCCGKRKTSFQLSLKNTNLDIEHFKIINY